MHQFRLPEDPSVVVTIGREEYCVISLPTILGLSGLHCSIARVGDAYVITDEGSTNGTYEGVRAIGSEPLRADAVYTIGDAALTFDLEIPAALPAEPEAPSSPALWSFGGMRLLASLLLLAGLGLGVCAALLACTDSNEWVDDSPQTQEENFHDEATFGKKATSGKRAKSQKVKHVDYIACGSRGEAIAFSPDGSCMVTCDAAGVARLWESRTAKLLPWEMRHGGSIMELMFTPDGTRLVPVSKEKNARLWDTQSGQMVGEPVRLDTLDSGLTVSPDGKSLVSHCRGDVAHVWNTRSGKAVEVGNRQKRKCAAFSPDSKRFAFAEGNVVRLCDTRSAQPVGEPMEYEANEEVWVPREFFRWFPPRTVRLSHVVPAYGIPAIFPVQNLLRVLRKLEVPYHLSSARMAGHSWSGCGVTASC